MKFTRLRYDTNSLIAAVAVSVLCHIVLVIVWGGTKHKLQEPQLAAGTVITAKLMQQAALAGAAKAAPAEAQAVDTAGGSKSSRGSPWRRSSAAIEAPYGLMPIQEMHTQRHKEQLYLGAQVRRVAALDLFLGALSSLQVVGVCRITLASDTPAMVVCDAESDFGLVTNLLAHLGQPLAIENPIKIEKMPNKLIIIE